MTIGLHRTFFLKKKLKCQVKPAARGSWPLCPTREGSRGTLMVPAGLQHWLPATGNTAYVLLCTISNSLLLENTVLYKNMTVSLENNIYFFFY